MQGCLRMPRRAVYSTKQGDQAGQRALDRREVEHGRQLGHGFGDGVAGLWSSASFVGLL